MLETTLPGLVIFVGAPLVIWWLRKTRRTGLPGTLKIVSRTALTRNGVVAVVESDDRRFLIGATDHGITLLTELDGIPATEAAGTVDSPANVDVKIMDDPAPRPVLFGGPGTSPLDALREMTVRKPTRTRPPHGRVRA